MDWYKPEGVCKVAWKAAEKQVENREAVVLRLVLGPDRGIKEQEERNREGDFGGVAEAVPIRANIMEAYGLLIMGKDL